MTISIPYELQRKVELYKDKEMLDSVSQACRNLIVKGLNYDAIQRKQREDEVKAKA